MVDNVKLGSIAGPRWLSIAFLARSSNLDLFLKFLEQLVRTVLCPIGEPHASQNITRGSSGICESQVGPLLPMLHL